MERNWTDFKSLYGNLAGAREAFETACETLFRKKYKGLHVSQVAVKNGDGGIDIFIGEFGVEPITVIQCKFFLDAFEDSQKNQIRDSFNTAVSSEKYELKEWILCIPRVIDIDENSWWFKWKHKMVEKYSKDKDFIKLTNGNELIDLFKELDLYNQIFNMEDSLKIDAIYKSLKPKEIKIPEDVSPNIALFNNYIPKCEPYYIEREQDLEFNESLKISNIWISGKSGVGKTTLIHRNLIQNNVEYCFCDLSPISISKSEDVLNDILCTIEDKYNTKRNCEETNLLKQINQIICKSGFNKTVIVIDELSVDDESVLKEIADDFLRLVTHFNNQSEECELKFVISTILNPISIIQNKSKACNYFQYISCDCWDEYSSKLFRVLSKALNLELEKSENLILDKSRNSPRMIKAILKKIIIYKDTSKDIVDKAIKYTLKEVVEL